MNPDALIEQRLEAVVAAAAGANSPARLTEAIRHGLFPGGARLRPRLCLSVAHACSKGDGAVLAAATAPATAIELMHCASLVHDDLPCFDNADMRRNKPSVHRAFGEALAVLAGDALIVMSFQAIAANAPAKLTAPLLQVVAAAVGPPFGIIAGQAWESENDINLGAYHRAKTGALFVAATRAGAICAGAEPDAWTAVGLRLGEAYQVADDIYDWTGAMDGGKPCGRDGDNARPNAVAALGLSAAREHFDGLLQEAADSVPPCAGAGLLRDLVMQQGARLMPVDFSRIAAE